MGDYLRLCLGTIVSPRKTFGQILSLQSLKYSWGTVLLYCLLYYITIIFLITNNLRPTMLPLLPISEESYYLWQLFFGLPVGLLGWLVMGSMVWGGLSVFR